MRKSDQEILGLESVDLIAKAAGVFNTSIQRGVIAQSIRAISPQKFNENRIRKFRA
jgi:hypothetical protein